jgi:hypothetical protein
MSGAMPRPLLIAAALAAAVVWAAVAGIVAVRQWPPAGAAIAQARDTGMRGCAGRYPEPAARERCEILFETQFMMERNIALFTRLLIAAGPLAAVAAWIALSRRPARHLARRARP